MRKLLTILLMWCCVFCKAQRHIVFSEDIASLQVVAGIRWQEMPVIRLDGNERIHISFDDLSHTYRRFSYSVTHMEADWTPSEGLFVTDYLAGFQDGLTIENSEESVNTSQNYTHYSLSLPNDRCRFVMSGNYRVDIKDDNDDEKPMISVFFMVNEDKVNVGLSYTDDTDIDVRKDHQQVEVAVDYSPLRATDARRQIKGYVLQNGRWDNARVLPEAPRITPRMLEWVHCKDLIFDAGNEYHKFEILDVHRNSLNVENNAWDGEVWHTILWPDYKRPSYVYDEAAKGAFYIRNTDNYENDVTSEYVMVHFILRSEPLPYRLFVNGVWTNDRFLPRYEMHYDIDQKCYEAVVPLKYGYYSYQYLMIADGDIEEGDVRYNERVGENIKEPLIPPTEGSFYQTRNNYNALIYYRGTADRADRLVGFR
ncbi:MAG: DUF5103 domain-containing protein [Prevotella sp.]|nr:DUF5103 domain-containing protein [Candidatus Prevotella equi]